MKLSDFNGFWKISELAEKLGVQPRTVKGWFSDDVKKIKGENYIDILDGVAYLCDKRKYAERLLEINECDLEKHSELYWIGKIISKFLDVLPIYVEGVPSEFIGKTKISFKLDLRII